MKTVISALLVSLGLTVVVVPALAGPRVDARIEGGMGAEDGVRIERANERDFGAVLSERRIARIIRRGGFAAIQDIRLRRDRYLVTAVRPNGAVFRLALDSRDGDIVGSERIGWSRGFDRSDYDRFRTGRNHRSGGDEFRLGWDG